MAIRKHEQRLRRDALAELIRLRSDFERSAITYCRIRSSREYLRDPSARTLQAATEAEERMVELYTLMQKTEQRTKP